MPVSILMLGKEFQNGNVQGVRNPVQHEGTRQQPGVLDARDVSPGDPGSPRHILLSQVALFAQFSQLAANGQFAGRLAPWLEGVPLRVAVRRERQRTLVSLGHHT